MLLLRSARPAPVATEALVRLRGELTAAGFQVEVADAPTGPDAQAAIDRAAAAANVDAVVAILGDPARETAEIHIVDPLTGKTIARQVPVPAGGDRGAEVLAIRALELLRASFLEVALGSSPHTRAASRVPARASAAPTSAGTSSSPAEHAGAATDRPPPPTEVPRPTDTPPGEVGRIPASRRKPLFAVELGGVVLGSAEGMGPAILPVVRAEARLGGRWLGRLTLAGLGTRARVSSGVAAADVAHSFGLIEVALPFRADRRVQPFLSLGAGGLRVTAEGRTTWAYQGKHDGLWAALVDAGAGLRVGLGARLQLAGELHAQGAYPHPVIRFLGTTLAEEGRPTLVAGLSLIAWL